MNTRAETLDSSVAESLPSAVPAASAAAVEWGVITSLWKRDLMHLVRERSRWSGVVLQPLLFWLIIGSGMGSVFLLMAIIFYIGSVMATKLFGESFPDWFGTLGLSAYSLFQIMTLESWSMGIVRPVMEVYPFAWAFFVPFILITTFAVVNLVVGLIVNSMQDAHAEEEVAATGEYREEILRRLEAIEKKLDRS